MKDEIEKENDAKIQMFLIDVVMFFLVIILALVAVPIFLAGWVIDKVFGGETGGFENRRKK